VLPLVLAQVDALDGHREQRQQALVQRRLVARQREDAPVVVRVGLHVQHPQARCTPQRGHRRVHDIRPAAFADVGHRLDQSRHGP